MVARRNALAVTRFGLSVPRTVGDAVRRNRMKRLIRETIRAALPSLPGGIDLVVVPRRPDAPPTLATVRPALLELLARVAARLARAEAP